MRLSLLVSLLVLLVAPATARQFTLFNYEQAPIGGTDETKVARIQAGIALPLRIGAVQTTHGVRFKQLAFEHGTAWPSSLPNGDLFREIRYEGSATFSARGPWAATVFVSTGLASDFVEDVSGADVDFQGALLMTRPTRTGSLGLGLAYRNRLDVALLPLIIYQAELGDSWRVDVLAPARAAAWYEARGQLALGVTFKYNQLSYHLSDHPMERLDQTLSTIGPSLRLGLGNLPLFLEAAGGMVLVNSMQYGTGDSEITEDAGSGAFFSVSLLARQ